MVAVAGVALAIGLVAFPWLSPAGVATSGIGGFWAVVALFLLIVVLIDLALARLSPAMIVVVAGAWASAQGHSTPIQLGRRRR